MPDRPDLIRGEPRPTGTLPPRYAPGLALPSYRHVPGVTPHPRHDAKGHSHGAAEPEADLTSPGEWRRSSAYLRSIDLYNEGYWWESHETLEALWVAAGKFSPQALFFQGIIQVAAANIKWHLKNETAAAFLAKEAGAKLARATREAVTTYMGLDVAAFVVRVRAFHIEGGGAEPGAWPPFIVLDA